MKSNSLPSTMAAEEAAFTTPEELNEKFNASFIAAPFFKASA
jgi:hypothetical protein